VDGVDHSPRTEALAHPAFFYTRTGRHLRAILALAPDFNFSEVNTALH
jgi:hypothetical protein